MNATNFDVQHKRLRDFAREIILKMFDEGDCIDESDIFEIALKHKLIRKEFAPKGWREENDKEHWYTFQQWLKNEN